MLQIQQTDTVSDAVVFYNITTGVEKWNREYWKDTLTILFSEMKTMGIPYL
ncbi:MAG: hypothetical protein K2I03_03415 [Lachnospiraceae bacterium]|nr:hypothetical protein [Lachnospiraceae bacterium]MDE6252045.1 hypothetical protein [Lachnospiraceae bacterium]